MFTLMDFIFLGVIGLSAIRESSKPEPDGAGQETHLEIERLPNSTEGQ